MTAETLALLTETERRTLARYFETLRERVGPRLLGVRLFGSVTCGEALALGHADPLRSRPARPRPGRGHRGVS